WVRRTAIASGAAVSLVAGAWFAIHHVPGFGPALADGTRAIFGPRLVAWIEDRAYGIADRVNRLAYRSAKPKTFWDAPAQGARPSAPSSAPEPDSSAPAAFPPPPFAPPIACVASDADGQWIPVASGGADPPAMYKSVVHPDAKRNFAAVAVVA